MLLGTTKGREIAALHCCKAYTQAHAQGHQCLPGLAKYKMSRSESSEGKQLGHVFKLVKTTLQAAIQVWPSVCVKISPAENQRSLLMLPVAIQRSLRRALYTMKEPRRCPLPCTTCLKLSVKQTSNFRFQKPQRAHGAAFRNAPPRASVEKLLTSVFIAFKPTGLACAQTLYAQTWAQA